MANAKTSDDETRAPSPTSSSRWLVGFVLVGVAIFLAVEVKSLLVGEAADSEISEAVRAVAESGGRVSEVLRIITIQQGPGEVMVALKLRMKAGLSGEELVAALNEFERALKAKRPEIRWIFAEPDFED